MIKTSTKPDNELLKEMFTNREWKKSVETTEKITPRKIAIEAKRRMLDLRKRKTAAELLDRLPEEDEFFHIVSDGSFDYWSLIPLIVQMANITGGTLHASTWTLNRPNCLEMLQMIDDGRLATINLLTGNYFKARESAVYATISNGLLSRGGRIRVLENHAKVAILTDGRSHFVMEGSANFTANPRIEQNIIARSRPLYEHHKNWIEDCLDAK
jgi:hypothetical protein